MNPEFSVFFAFSAYSLGFGLMRLGFIRLNRHLVGSKGFFLEIVERGVQRMPFMCSAFLVCMPLLFVGIMAWHGKFRLGVALISIIFSLAWVTTARQDGKRSLLKR